MSGFVSDEPAFLEEQAEQTGVRLVTFTIAGEVHALPVAAVEEVVVDRRIHRLPDMPAAMLGMLPLRGSLIPVLDAAAWLGLQPVSAGPPAVLILERGRRRIGLAADAVLQVVRVPEDRLPHTAAMERLVMGIVRTDGGLITLLDPTHLWAIEGTKSWETAT